MIFSSKWSILLYELWREKFVKMKCVSNWRKTKVCLTKIFLLFFITKCWINNQYLLDQKWYLSNNRVASFGSKKRVKPVKPLAIASLVTQSEFQLCSWGAALSFKHVGEVLSTPPAAAVALDFFRCAAADTPQFSCCSRYWKSRTVGVFVHKCVTCVRY